MYTIHESKGQGRAHLCCRAPDRQITRPVEKESIGMLVTLLSCSRHMRLASWTQEKEHLVADAPGMR